MLRVDVGRMWTRRALLVSGGALTALPLLPVGVARAATDQLRLALGHEPPHLDPVAGDDPSTLAVSYQNIFEGLTQIDERNEVQPGLARSWTISPDRLAYTFALQTEVSFHDGTSFDAGHVLFSLKRLIRSRDPAATAYLSVADVVAVDDKTVRLQLERPDALLLYKLGLPPASIVAPESADNIAGARDDFDPAEYAETVRTDQSFLIHSPVTGGDPPPGLSERFDLPQLLQHVVQRLWEAGIAEIISVRLGGEEMGISVVRVLVPALEDRGPNINWRPGRRALSVIAGVT